jgi:tetratricopeptide (TPR) repeat protein
LLLPGEQPPAGWTAPGFDLEPALREEGLLRWWSALCAEGLRQSRQGAAPGIETLERGWGRALLSAQPTSSAEEESPLRLRLRGVSGHDARLVARLRLAGRPWPLRLLGALGFEAEGLRRLLDAGLVLQGEGALVRPADELGDFSPESEDLGLVARALRQHFPSDAWSQEQAAWLLARGGALVEAEAAHTQAIRSADDVIACADLWASWGETVEGLTPAERHGCSVRSAELALARGDADGALVWAERAVALRPDEHRSQEALGRALLGRGDLVGADVALAHALETARNTEQRATILAGRAEVRYAQGRTEDAESLARKALDLAPGVPCAIAARNTLGKLLLARGLWGQAEEHFAADAAFAARLGDPSAQLRARLNRAIAVMSSGRLHEARPMLEGVLDEGRQQGDERAVAFALSNLAVLAMNRHEYGEALLLSEQAIGIRRRVGERLGLARVIANLAELRLRLGLLDEAQQTLSFGRLTVSRGASLPRNAHFALIAARIHLARGHTLPATRELATALAGAGGSSDGDMIDECHRVGARIALEEGDPDRARQELDLAQQKASSPYAHAEIALLRAHLLRAVGLPSREAAQQAVLLARQAGDEEFMREAHTLAAQIARDGENPELARSHLHQALALREHVLSGLPEPLRKTFLLRRDLVALARLERELSAPLAPLPLAPEGPRSAPRPRPSVRLLAGEDPAIRGLLDGVRKVARTDVTVLVLGESGTGKELIAEAIHRGSPRAKAPLRPPQLRRPRRVPAGERALWPREGRLHRRRRPPRGRFKQADGGTLFLDEVSEIPLSTQVKLLRFLQERTFERVGGNETLKVDVRILAASNRDLRRQVSEGRFREDLYYRLNVVSVEIPPLRQRRATSPRWPPSSSGATPRRTASARRLLRRGPRRPHRLPLARQRPRAGERPPGRHPLRRGPHHRGHRSHGARRVVAVPGPTARGRPDLARAPLLAAAQRPGFRGRRAR